MTGILSERLGERSFDKAGEAPVVILGPHRAGTSLLAAMMEECGLFLGARTDSHGESTFFQRINRRMMLEFGCHWTEPRLAMARLGSVGDLTPASDAIREYLSGFAALEYWGRSPSLHYRCWGWKDPRNCVLLPLWTRIFPRSVVVSIHRHPMDCALSLHKRSQDIAGRMRAASSSLKGRSLLRGGPLVIDSFRTATLTGALDVAIEYLQVQRHNLASFDGVHVDISYEDLVRDPDIAIAKIATGLGQTRRLSSKPTTRPHIDSLNRFRHNPEALELCVNRRSELGELGYSTS